MGSAAAPFGVYFFVTLTLPLLFAAFGSGVGEATEAVLVTVPLFPCTAKSMKNVRVGEPATNVPIGQVRVALESVQPPLSKT